MIYQAVVDYTKQQINGFPGGEKQLQNKVVTALAKEMQLRGALHGNMTVECAGTNRQGVKRYIGEVAVMTKADFIEMEKKAMEYDAIIARVKGLGGV